MEFKFLATYVLVLIALFYSYRSKLGLEKDIFVNSLRALIQLLILGYLLVYIFRLRNPIGLSGILFFMVLFASYTAHKRVELRGFIIPFLSILLSSFIVLSSLLLLRTISFKANEIIPVGGMVIGNALNVVTLTANRFKGEVDNTMPIIEGMLALGAPLKEALTDSIKNSIKAAMIPILNSLQTVGIVHIPGIATGMLIAGAEPLKAISYQLVIMYMLVAVSLFAGIFTITFSYKRIITKLY